MIYWVKFFQVFVSASNNESMGNAKYTLSLGYFLAVTLFCGIANAVVAEQADTIDVNKLAKISASFARALTEKNPQLFYPLLDKDALVKIALSGKKFSAAQTSDFSDNIIRGLADLPIILISKLGYTGKVTYLRLVKRGNEYHGLIRMSYQQYAVSYIELFIHKNKQQQYKIYDYYDYSLGRRYSKIVNQLLVDSEQFKRGHKQSQTFAVLLSSQSEQTKYETMVRLYRSREYKKALQAIRKLSREYRATRDGILLQAQIAQAVSTTDYGEALQILANKFSEDEDLGLLFMDYYIYSKQYIKAFKAIDKFAHYIGNDIALENIKVKLYIAEKKFALAITSAENAIYQDDSYEEIYWPLLKANLVLQRYKSVTGIIKVLEKKFKQNIDPDQLMKNTLYQQYVLSEEFTIWKQSRTKQE